MTDAGEPEPWGAMMRTALGMGIGPQVFWALSLKEWRWLVEPAGGQPQGLPRSVLEQMMQRWPDDG